MLKKYEPKDYPNLDVTIYENIEHISIINSWYETCLQNINWVEGEIKIFGKIHKIPRLQAWYSDHGINYSYSGKVLDQNIWNIWLKKDPIYFLKDRIDNVKKLKTVFLSVGEFDQFLLQYGARKIRKMLLSHDVDFSYEEFKGNHFDISTRRKKALSLI